MYAYNLINSDEKRLARKVLIEQSKLHKPNYYNNTKTIAEQLGITFNMADLQEVTKSTWKQLIKRKIKEEILHDIEAEVKTKTKMRFVSKREFKAEDYIKKLNMKETKTIMRLKLNMVDTKANFPRGDDRTCVMCGAEDETTEHLFKCPRYQYLTGHNLSWSDCGDHWTDIEWMRKAVSVVERMEEIREREVNRLS